MKSKYDKWVSAMMESWKNLEGSKTAYLFSEDVEYYEALDTPPCSPFNNIVKLWEVVPSNQSDIQYRFEIIASDEKCGVVNWVMHRKLKTDGSVIQQYIDGIFQIKLNAYGKCCYFKQWRFTKVEDYLCL